MSKAHTQNTHSEWLSPVGSWSALGVNLVSSFVSSATLLIVSSASASSASGGIASRAMLATRWRGRFRREGWIHRKLRTKQRVAVAGG